MNADGAVRSWAVVPAAGSGARMGSGTPKQYLSLAGQPILQHTLAAMLGWNFLDGIVVALAEGDQRWPLLDAAADARVTAVAGGAERADSVLAGLRNLASRAAPNDWVLVHDAARPCVSAASIAALRETLAEDPVGGLLALPVSETVKRGDAESRVLETVDRSGLWLAQTPQMFRFGLLHDALVAALAGGGSITDEAAAVELAGHRPRLVAGEPGNIKITHPRDLALAEALLKQGELH
jgi:2-C-methyl-D-erythritol 4-phosphate cytidylyltransferase